jgi:two-component system response regulator PilR (NtrC family)
MSRILVVDDEQSIREYLEVLLLRGGHQVALAASLEQAMAELTRSVPDLVITDFKLGPDSGMDVLKAARSTPQPPEVIVITEK